MSPIERLHASLPERPASARGLALGLGLGLLVALQPAGLRAAEPAPAAKPAAAASAAKPPARPAAASRTVTLPESPAARTALLELIGSLDEGEAVDGASASARTVTAVRPGETLDVIVRRTMGDLPFKESFMRALFVEVNPRAYPNGNVQRLDPGTPLNVPSLADVRAALQRSLGPARAAALRGNAAPPAGSAAAASANMAQAVPPAVLVLPPPPPKPDHRGWVRFP